MEVKWEEPTRFDALGRNGYIKSCGLSVLMIGSELFLEPLTRRGEIGRARIVVPIKAAPNILHAIAQECRLMLQREGLYPPELPSLSSRRNNTNADADGEKHVHAEALPPICYIRDVTTGETVAIRRRMDGFTSANTLCSPECLNSRLPQVPTEDEIAAMKHGTLLGWDTPGANPTFWRRRRESIR